MDGKDEVCKCCETVCYANEKQITKWSSGSRLPKWSVSEGTLFKIVKDLRIFL